MATSWTHDGEMAIDSCPLWHTRNPDFKNFVLPGPVAAVEGTCPFDIHELACWIIPVRRKALPISLWTLTEERSRTQNVSRSTRVQLEINHFPPALSNAWEH